MKLSVIIPARNEEAVIENTVKEIVKTLEKARIEYEILVINDGSTDATESILTKLSVDNKSVRYLNNPESNGFGRAVRLGLDNFSGNLVAIMMADMSDLPSDLVRFYEVFIMEKVDCVFGNRFARTGLVSGYPKFKLLINRLGNILVKMLFLIPYNDTTNAFKMYSKETITKIKPLRANGFNLTLEMPLKAILSGAKFKVLENSWHGREKGVSKFKIGKTVAGYFPIIFRCLLDRYNPRSKSKRV